MKFKTLIFASIAALTCFTACSDDDDDASATAPSLVSSTPAHADTGVSVDLTEIVLTYDQNVSCLGNFDFNGTTLALSKCTISGTTVTVDISDIELESGTKYTLTIPAGKILSENQAASADEHSIIFYTEEAEEEEIAVDLADTPVMAANFEAGLELYEFLVENYGSYTISATMANVAWNFDEAKLVYAATGKYPKIATMDYIHLFTMRDDWTNQWWVVDYTDIDDVKAWNDAGGYLSASWHWNVPLYEGIEVASDGSSYTYEPGSTTFSASNVYTEGTWEYEQALGDLEVLTTCLKALQDEGIALIWRPLHEAAGNYYAKSYSGTAWFWWGYEGPEVYVKLWQYVYNYLSDQGINNLIWVWTTQSVTDSTYGDDDDYYPGDDYVDIIGIDIYTNTAAYCAKQFKNLQKKYPNKLITLSECGSVGNISDQWAAGGCWSYFMPWYTYDVEDLSEHEHADTDWWTDAMNSEYVITLDGTPSFTEE